MRMSTTLPFMTGLAIVGTALGASLGRSAVDEINPAYFTDPEVPFHADQVPNGSPDWAQVQLSEYQAPTLVQGGLGSGCVGCRPAAAEYVPQAMPSETYVPAPVRYAAAEPQAEVFVEPQPRDPEWERVERYATYQVEEAAPAEEAEALELAGTQ